MRRSFSFAGRAMLPLQPVGCKGSSICDFDAPKAGSQRNRQSADYGSGTFRCSEGSETGPQRSERFAGWTLLEDGWGSASAQGWGFRVFA